MTDTQTETTAKRERNVNYTLEIVDELPAPRRGGGGGGGASPFEPKLQTIASETQYHKKWVLIAGYKNATAATAAKNVLQQRHGRSANVEGYAFATRPIKEGAEQGLFVSFDPEAIVPGAKEQHEKAEKERIATLEAKRAEREAARSADANGESNAKATGAVKKAAAKK